jgi:hypothetical protein
MEQLAGQVAVNVAERAAEIMAAFDAQAPRYPGDEVIDARAVMARPRTSTEGRS